MSRFFRTLSNLFKVPELRNRIFVTLGLLAVFRFGTVIPLPGIDPSVISELLRQMEETVGSKTMGFLSLFSGGGMLKISIFSLGIMPYITSAILFQMLTKTVPALEEIQKEGPNGRRKIKQWTRLAAVPVCIFQGLMIGIFLTGNPMGLDIVKMSTTPFLISTVTILTAGGIFVMWLGEQITEHGVGQGASILILAGIIAAMPPAIRELWAMKEGIGVSTIMILGFLYVGIVAGITFLNLSQRRIPVQHGKHVRGRRMYGGQRNFLPLKVNQAGVMPLIFASALLIFPTWISRLLEQSGSGVLNTLGNWIGLMGMGGGGESLSFLYVSFYIVLVYFFSYFWTALMFQPQDMAEQLKESGSFVPGVRPGQKTADFLEKIMNRVTLVGGAFLCIVALIPDIVTYELGVGKQFTTFLGGTGMIIVVRVTIDTVQRVESQMLMREYEGFFQKGSQGRQQSRRYQRG